MKTKMLALLAMLLASGVAFGKPASGSYPGKAKSLKSSQTVVLVNEYDPDEEDKEDRYLDSGVCYYKVTLSKGGAYTIWLEGGNTETMDFDVYTDEDYYGKSEKREDKEPAADFDGEEINDGETKIAYMYAESWEDEDPGSGKYIVAVYGEIGESATLHFTSGIKTFTRKGSEESPETISFKEKWGTRNKKLLDEGEYWFRAKLKAGRKYRVYTRKGSATAGELDIAIDPTDADELGNQNTEDDEAYTNAWNDAYVITPFEDEVYTFVVSGEASQAFTFKFMAVPKRAISAHPALPLLAENRYETKFVPGRLSNTQNYHDAIIDEHLSKIYLNKGERWVFETAGASKEQKMVAYDSKGKVLASNVSAGNGSLDSRVVVSATASGLYYVGVYDPDLGVYDGPDSEEVEHAGEIVLSARNGADLPKPDLWDSDDDVYTGANLLTPYPATTNDTPVAITEANREAAVQIGAIHGPHRLGPNDLYDFFAIPCRKGFTYSLRAKFDSDDDTTNLKLASKVFRMASGKQKAVTTTGTISPEWIEDIESDEELPGDLTFTADVNGMYYVQVWVSDGKGLDFPGYTVHAIVAKGMQQFGLVTAELSGAAGTWSVGTEAAKYASGAVLAVAPTTVSVKFNAVSGFSVAPDTAPATVPAWNPGDEPVKVAATYSDAYDTKYVMSYTTKKVKKNGKTTTEKTPNYSPADGDATPAGAFAITPSNKAATLKRTLWESDPADHFSFTAAAGTYYNFTVDSLSSNVTLVVSNAVTGATVAGTPLADGTGSEVSKLALDAGKSFVIVSHGDGEEKDATYTLTYSKASPGVVQFTNAKAKAANTFTVKEGTEYATLYVARTGTEGAMRVKYATQAGTALPGTNYYPVTDGEVSWKAGDKAAKAIKIRMIPDLYAHWASSNLTFSVRLFPADELGLDANEYPTRTNATTEATVTIVESTAKTPGTISLVAYGEGSDEDETVANVKKPVVTGIAGDDNFTLTFRRTGGTDGKVSVKVSTTTAKGDTAKAGKDYVTVSDVLTWEDGDDEDKTFEIELPETGGATVSKKFSLTMAVVKTGFTPTLSAKTATVNVKNASIDQMAVYGKTIPSAAGMKLSTTGTWFLDYEGNLCSTAKASTFTYTLTGPGFFICEPSLVLDEATEDDVEPSAKLTCQFNKEAPIDCSDTNENTRIVRVIGKGTTTVKIALSNVKGNAYATFEKQNEDGVPYIWVPFSDVVPADPMDKAVVMTNQTTLAWTLPDDLMEENGLYCRVRFDKGAKATTVITNDFDGASASYIPVALEAGQTYAWGLDFAYTDETNLTYEALNDLRWTSGSTWTFSVLKEGAPITAFNDDCVDASGESVTNRLALGEAIELLQGVKPGLLLGGEGEGDNAISANGFRIVSGSIPGLKIDAARGVLTGAPSKPGDYTLLLQSYNDKIETGKYTTKKVKGKTTKVPVYSTVYGSTIALPVTVLPAGTSIGTFRGTLFEDGVMESGIGTMFPDNAQGAGSIVFTATSAGKLTAKVTIAGIAYTFTGTGYDEVLDYDDTSDGTTRQLQATLTGTIPVTTTVKGKKTTKKYTNELTLTMCDGDTTNAVAIAEKLGSVQITNMKVLNAKKTAFTADVSYAGDLYRSNNDSDEGKEAMADFVGYYTVALAPEQVVAADGVPTGNGYLTLAVSAAGTVKVTGALADGTAVSFSTIGQVIGTSDNGDGVALSVPIYIGKSTTYALAGVVQIAYPEAGDGEEAVPVAKPSAKLIWLKTKSATTSRDGSGFTISLAPTGGWYDKLVNLQKYYIDGEFAIQAAETGDDLPTAALDKGFSFATESTPSNAVRFVGNSLAVDARKLVKNNTLGLYDFVSVNGQPLASKSVNPWNVTLKFTRATGLVSGTFSAWEWTYTTINGITFPLKQKEIKGLAHKGVLLFSRDDSSESPLAGSALTAGFFLMPATTSTKASVKNKAWKASLPFNILMDVDEKTWEEKDFDDGDGEGND